MDLQKEIRRTISIGASSALVVRGVQVLAAIVSVPVIVAALGGPAGYGVWAIISSIFTMLALCDLGLNNGLARLIARARGKKIPLGALLKTMLYAECVVGAVIVFLSLFIALILPGLVDVSETNNLLISYAVIIRGLGLALTMPLRIATPLLTGHQHYGLHLIGDLVASILFTSGVLLFYFFSELDLMWLAIFSSVSSVAGALTGFMIAKKVTDKWGLRESKPKRRYLKLGLGLGAASVTVTAAVALSIQGTTLILGIMATPYWAGIWSICAFVTAQVSHIGASLSAPFTTYAAQLEAERRTEQLKKALSSVALFIAAFSSTTTISIAIFGENLAEYILPSIAEQGSSKELIYILVILLALLTISLPMTAIRNFLIGTKKHWVVARWLMISSLVGLVFLVSLLPLLEIWAAIVSRMMFLVLPVFGLYVISFKRLLKERFYPFLLNMLTVIFCPIALGLLFLKLNIIDDVGIVLYIINLIVFSLLAFCAALLFVNDFRKAIKQYIRWFL